MIAKSNRSPASMAKDTMTVETQNNQQETQASNKELNFRQLEAKFERRLAEERAAREQAEKLAKEALEKAQSRRNEEEDEKDDEPYVDHRKLNKTLNKFGQSTQTEIQKAMELAKEKAKEEIKQEMWLENNRDFYDVMQHVEKFAAEAPDLAETILKMPEGFERQKLVYQNIKRLGIDKPPPKQSTVQEKIDQNRRSPYYQPSGVGNAPYTTGGDFSQSGQKNAYSKLQELKNRLRLG